MEGEGQEMMTQLRSADTVAFPRSEEGGRESR